MMEYDGDLPNSLFDVNANVGRKIEANVKKLCECFSSNASKKDKNQGSTY